MLPLLLFGYDGIGITLVISLLGSPAPVLYFCCERWLPKRTTLKHLLFIGYWFAWTTLLIYMSSIALEGAGIFKAAAIGISIFSAASYLAILFTLFSKKFFNLV